MIKKTKKKKIKAPTSKDRLIVPRAISKSWKKTKKSKKRVSKISKLIEKNDDHEIKAYVTLNNPYIKQ